MTPDRQRLVESIFAEAAECQPDARPALVEARCNGDAELRADVESLLSHLDAAGSNDRKFLDPDELHDERAARESDDALLPNTRIAEFTIIGKIGEGGMGVVYVAEQARPRRIVALKLIRPGLATAGTTRRLEHEAEILGRLAHPGIAQIFEAGVAPTARGVQPYIAMERIDGPPLTTFAAQRKLDIRERLRLMIRVCAAVQHAHQRGVIHRDLKPSNILVSCAGPMPEPKILDFGVARVVQDDRQRDMTTLHTSIGQFIGTLAYMSPEQVVADPDQIDTRSDVYALGVILYELLSGRLPLDVRTKPMTEAARMIREDEPARLGAVDQTLHGDIETIVAKALEKERERRYQSAAALGEDLERMLDGRPILARNDAALYVLRKQIRRHRFGVATAAVFLLGIVVFGVYAGWQARVRARQADELRRNLYVSAIGFAQAAYASRDPDRMKRVLNSCPPEMRGWEWRYLRRIADTSDRTAELPAEGLASVTASVNGTRFATFAGKGLVQIFDAPTNRQLAQFDLGEALSNVVVTDVGRDICLMGSSSGNVLIADIATGTTRTLTVAQGSAITPYWIDPDRDRFFAAITEPTGRRTGRVLALTDARTLKDLGTEIGYGGAPSRDGRLAAIPLEDGRIRLCDLTDGGAPDRTLTVASTPVRPVAFSPDGQYLAAGSFDGLVTIFDLATGDSRAIPISDNKVLACVWSPDGGFLAAGGTEPVIRIIEVREKAPPRVVSTLFGHDARVDMLAWNPSGLVSGARDRTLRWWSHPTCEATPIGQFGIDLSYAAIDPRGQSLYVGCGDGRILDINPHDLTLKREMANMGVQINGVSITRDGSLVSACATSGEVCILDAHSAARIATLHSTKGAAVNTAFDPAGRRIVLASVSDAPTLWDAHSGAMLAEWGRFDSTPDGAAWSPDGATVAIGYRNGTVRLHDPADGHVLRELKHHQYGLFQICFTPNGRTLCTPDDGGLICLWDVSSGKLLRTLVGHQRGVFSIGLSPDGTRLVSGGWDNTVRLWKLEDGQELLNLRGHIGGVTGAVFTPDGEAFLSVSGDGTVRRWSANPPEPPVIPSVPSTP